MRSDFIVTRRQIDDGIYRRPSQPQRLTGWTRTWHGRCGSPLTGGVHGSLISHDDVVHGVQVTLHGLDSYVGGLHSGRQGVIQNG